MNHPLPSKLDLRSAAGFTLIELFVAILLASMAIWLAYYLFETTRRATRVGLERSTIYQNALVAETRLRMDMGSLIGPYNSADQPAGAVVIIPALASGTIPIAGNTMEQTITKLRSDQLVVFYDAKVGGLIRNTGTGPKLKSLTISGAASNQAKIWMGHVKPTTGQPASATQWTLGRQAVLLIDPDLTTINTPATLDATTVLSPANPLNMTADVAPWGLPEIANWMRAPGRTDTEMVTAFAVNPNNINNYTNIPSVETQPLSDNNLTVSDIFSGHRIFLNNCSEFIVQYAGDYNPYDLADPKNYDGQINTDGPNDYSGQALWYPRDTDIYDTASPLHAAAMAPVVFYPTDDQVRVWHVGYYQGPDASKYRLNRWGDYTPYPLVNGQEFGDALPDRPAYDAAMAAYADHHNGYRPAPTIPPRQSHWPQLIRIRYRLHDPHGQIFSYMDEFLSNKRDDNGINGIDDPAENRISGLWFEHVFSIPYPRSN